MRTADFDYALPESAIARYPAQQRDGSRLLMLERSSGALSHHRFTELPDLLQPEDLVVVNDSKVLPARLEAHKVSSGGRVELLLVEPVDGSRRWRALAGASKPVRSGTELDLGGARARVVDVEGAGFVVVDLSEDGLSIADRLGALPLPPYLRRDAEPSDSERYQTIFARSDRAGSVAAPTAGLHFTPALTGALKRRRIGITAVTLHVGPGTFLPVRTDEIEAHTMHAERYLVDPAAVTDIAAADRIVAVGTTVVRVLESGEFRAGEGQTNLFIRPGYEFARVGAMLTNFHLPCSSLLMLVCAFAGREAVLDAYRRALEEGYRFYSYGDAMLII